MVTPETKMTNVYKDIYAKWLHSQDPDLSIETLNALPTEEIMAWHVTTPLSATPFFRNWVTSELCGLYRDEELPKENGRKVSSPLRKR